MPAARLDAARARRHLLRGVLVYAAATLAVCLLWSRPVLLLLALLLLAGGYCVSAGRAQRACLLVGALLGPGAECLAIASGAWSYTGVPTLIPLWLPPAWGLACACLLDIVDGLLAGWQRPAQLD